MPPLIKKIVTEVKLYEPPDLSEAIKTAEEEIVRDRWSLDHVDDQPQRWQGKDGKDARAGAYQRTQYINYANYGIDKNTKELARLKRLQEEYARPGCLRLVTRHKTFGAVDTPIIHGGPAKWVASRDGFTYWYCREAIYQTTEDDLDADDISALVDQEKNATAMKVAKAKAVRAMAEEMNPKTKRSSIPQDIKVTVWERDGGKCVNCGSRELIEFDHIIPLAMGGSNTFRNLQLLCESCNRSKGANL